MGDLVRNMGHDLSSFEKSHRLEWYACYCVTLAESCNHPRAERLLRALSVDLAIEAAMQRKAQPQLIAHPAVSRAQANLKEVWAETLHHFD